jgi:hypothetical protein
LICILTKVAGQKFKAVARAEPLVHLERFHLTDIVYHTNAEKLHILSKQPSVLVNHSKPFPIALVEEGTNVVYTKALLINHLFLSYTSPCILCPLCKKFLNVYDFTRHLHDIDVDNNDAARLDPMSDDDYDEDHATSRRAYINSILSHKKFSILPYQTANNPLTEADMSVWKHFAQSYMLYKQERLAKRDKHKQLNKTIQQVRKYGKIKKSKTVLTTKDEFMFNEFNNWDYITKSKTVFILNKTRMDKENCIIVENKFGALVRALLKTIF